MSEPADSPSAAESTAGPKVSFRIRRDDFLDVLNDAGTCVGHDLMLPMLVGIYLTISPAGVLVAQATDRFTMARRTYVLDTESADSEFEFTGAEELNLLLPHADAVRIGRMHVRGARGFDARTLSVDIIGRTGPGSRGSIKVESGGSYDAKVTSTHRGIDADFIQAQRLYDEAKPVEMAGALFDPAKVAQFAKVTRRRGDGMRISFTGARKPLLVEIGEQFVGLIMPMRDGRDGVPA